MKKRSNKYPLVFLTIFFVVIVDQTSKYLFKNYSICNDGMFLGVGSGFGVLAIPVIILLGFLINKEHKSLFLSGYSLILAGGFSNFIDRLRFGCVLDFIPLLNLSKFNFADSVVSAGVLLVFVGLIYKKNA